MALIEPQLSQADDTSERGELPCLELAVPETAKTDATAARNGTAAARNGRSNAGRIVARSADGRILAVESTFSDDEIATALHANRGGVWRAAESLGCSGTTVSNHIKRNPTLKAIVQHYRALIVDSAENQLWKSVESGDAWAVQFTLKTLGKSRGYVERVETRNRTTVAGALVSFLQPQQIAGLLGENIPQLPDGHVTPSIEGVNTENP